MNIIIKNNYRYNCKVLSLFINIIIVVSKSIIYLVTLKSSFKVLTVRFKRIIVNKVGIV